MRISSLYFYPLKSARAIEVSEAVVTQHGLQHDRRWMVVDKKGRFLTQRRFPQMALLVCQADERRISLQAPDRQAIAVMASQQPQAVRIWGFDGHAWDCGDAAATWMSEFLHHECRLVMADEKMKRSLPPGYGSGEDEVFFADAFPFLLISQASLDDLNTKLDVTVPMNRFRPNIVIEGCSAYAEDNWKHLRIGDIDFTAAKLCNRCTMPTVDQANAIPGDEPIRTLSTYRRLEDGEIYFGQNLIHQQKTGILRVGDAVEIVA